MVQVPEFLTDTEKAQLYVAGEPLQQRFLAENLAGLVQGSGPAALSALSSQLEGLASALDEDGQVCPWTLCISALLERVPQLRS